MDMNKMIRLAGLQEAKRVIEDAIKALEDSGVEPVALDRRTRSAKSTPGKKRRTLSADARKKIADAQKRRWAKASTAVDAAHAGAGETTPAPAQHAPWQPPTQEEIEAATR